MRCPHCQKPIDVQLIKAPPMQADEANAGDRPESTKMDITYLLDAINDKDLDGKNADFVEQMREKAKKYRGMVFVSPKQLAWLEKLAGVSEEF